MERDISPSLAKPSFKCPHCTANAHQKWFFVSAHEFEKDYGPSVISRNQINAAASDMVQSGQDPGPLIEYGEKFISGQVFLGDRIECWGTKVNNLWLSKCFSCGKAAVWVYTSIRYPDCMSRMLPNDDLPDDIKNDFTEAAQILELSPRGAAALLRLCIQKLCAHLGKPGKDINADIKSLVKDGLDPRIQKSLDIVRVVGNSAVHPGSMDIADDHTTASALFRLVNLIVEKTISEPKHVDDFYESLPESKREAIEKRDG
jgi:endogenous inhibitor of DNA gyrase (YacG/DUF329 family)